jgi:Zn-dependent peptidase ImmA (M78 family)
MTTTWNLEQARRQAAADFAEQIVKDLGIVAPPIDAFRVLRSEKRRIIAYGDDFGDAFDGRLEYQRPRFLLFYNTKYDAWPHIGEHHPKVIFTVAHELAHFFLKAHFNYLKHGGRSHGSLTEFVSDNNSEREADAFAAGLLMPAFLADAVINNEPPTLEAVKKGRDVFNVSLTSMLVRWVQMSHFPCAMCSVRDGVIEWGFTSEAFKRAGAYKVNRGENVTSRPACRFLNADPAVSRFREEESTGRVEAWLVWDKGRLDVTEHYVAIPSVKQVLVLITAEEDDVFQEDDD